jgi:hypothetical protein
LWQLSYRFENGWRLRLDVPNLFNSNTGQVSRACAARLPSDPFHILCNAKTARVPVSAQASLIPACPNGVMDVPYPVEPFAVRDDCHGEILTMATNDFYTRGPPRTTQRRQFALPWVTCDNNATLDLWF